MTTTTQFTAVPESNAVVENRRHPGPQRRLDARLANAIRAGKERSGLSWRGLAAETGISRSFLNGLSLGRRVPSRRTAEVLVAALNLDGDIADELRAAAARPWWERTEQR